MTSLVLVVAQIKETFAASTVVDSFGITKLTNGPSKTCSYFFSDRSMGRLIASGYGESNTEYGIVQQAADPEDKSSPYLWDLKELYYIPEGSGIASVTAGTVIDAGLGTNRIRITTSRAHNLNPNDIVRVTGTTVAGW